ncbi:hypothetical protein ACPV5G_20385 [Photobacterium damselae]|uniref:hypothetical protein n=1 Tax=Photobacterium damselae TaxID=38293 RepID=UPI0040680517
MKNLKVKLFHILKKMNLLPEDIISIKELEYGRGLEKQLDEYRQLLEHIEEHTGYFSSPDNYFAVGHAAVLDDYLSYLYELRFGQQPTPNTAINYLRAKPSFIQM